MRCRAEAAAIRIGKGLLLLVDRKANGGGYPCLAATQMQSYGTLLEDPPRVKRWQSNVPEFIDGLGESPKRDGCLHMKHPHQPLPPASVGAKIAHNCPA